jgi:hypothetical protein
VATNVAGQANERRAIRKKHMYTPEEFQVNQTWLAFKANDEPLMLGDGSEYNLYGLMDAGSCFVFGVLPAGENTPDVREVEELFTRAEQMKNECARELFITDRSDSLAVFKEVAEAKGMTARHVPASKFQAMIVPFREAMLESFEK